MEPSSDELGGVRPKGGGLRLQYHQGWVWGRALLRGAWPQNPVRAGFTSEPPTSISMQVSIARGFLNARELEEETG